MKKNLLLCLFIGLVSFIGISSASAKVATVDDLINTNNNEEIIIGNYIKTDDGFKIVGVLDSNYETNFKVENNIITYVDNRDYTNISDEEKFNLISTDYTFCYDIVSTLFHYYGLDYSNDIDEQKFGIIHEKGSQISYTADSGSIVSTNSIKSFSIDLEKFDQAVTEAIKEETNNNTDITTEIEKPITENEIVETQTTIETTKETIEEEAEEVNPNTGDNIKYVIISLGLVLAVISICGYKLKKKYN